MKDYTEEEIQKFLDENTDKLFEITKTAADTHLKPNEPPKEPKEMIFRLMHFKNELGNQVQLLLPDANFSTLDGVSTHLLETVVSNTMEKLREKESAARMGGWPDFSQAKKITASDVRRDGKNFDN